MLAQKLAALPPEAEFLYLFTAPGDVFVREILKAPPLAGTEDVFRARFNWGLVRA